MDDGAGLEELEAGECLALLRSLSVGRVAVNRADLPPLVVPVNYVMHGEALFFRTEPGTKFDALLREPVSFQVDSIDPIHRTGWSVLIAGAAVPVTRGGDLDGEEVVIESWVVDTHEHHLVRLMPTNMTGRRIRLPEIVVDSRGYL